MMRSYTSCTEDVSCPGANIDPEMFPWEKLFEGEEDEDDELRAWHEAGRRSFESWAKENPY